MFTITNTQNTPTPREIDVAAVIEELRQRHIQKHGHDNRYLMRIGHRLGVSVGALGAWRSGRTRPTAEMVLRLVLLSRKPDPFNYDYLKYEKAKRRS